MFESYGNGNKEMGRGAKKILHEGIFPNFENEVCPTLAILTMVVAVVDSMYSTESSWTTGAARRVCTLMSIGTSVV